MNIIQGEITVPKNKIGIIVSCFNEAITDKLLASALQRCTELGINEDLSTVVRVPGAVELPLVADRLAQRLDIAAIVCLGAVIKGETAHFEYVSQVCMEGCNRVMLDHKKPVILGVLTTYTYAQATARVDGKVIDTGAVAIDTACKMVSLCEQIKTMP